MTYFMSHTLGKYTFSCSVNSFSVAGKLVPVMSFRRYLKRCPGTSEMMVAIMDVLVSLAPSTMEWTEQKIEASGAVGLNGIIPEVIA